MIIKKVNCIIPTYNAGRYLPDAVNSVINQDIGFENVNLVIVDDGSTDDTEEIVRAYQLSYPGIFYISKENGGVSSARNAGLDFCKEKLEADYTCFLDADDKYSIWHMKALFTFFERYDSPRAPDVVFIPIRLFEKQSGFHYIHKAINYGETRVIDLNVENVFFCNVNAAMYKTSAIMDIRFDETLSISEDADFVLKLLLKTNLAGWYNKKTFYFLRKRMDESSAIDNADSNPALYKRISHYRKEFENYIASMGAVPRAVQTSRLYDIHWFKQEDNDPTKYEIDVDIDQAFEDVKYMIQNMDADLLEQDYIPYWHRAYFKKMKYGEVHLEKVANQIAPYFFVGEEPLESLSGNIEVQLIKQVGQTLQIRGFFVKPNYDGIILVCKVNNRISKVVVKPSNQNDQKYFLGREVFPAMDFELYIDISKFKRHTRYALEFYFDYLGFHALAIPVHSQSSRFYSSNLFFIGDNAIIRTYRSNHALEIEKLSKASLNTQVIGEIESYRDPYLFYQYVGNFDTYRKKRIWLFMESPIAIGGNAEALFRYSCNIADGIEKFMVIPDASYYANFTGVNPNIIIFGSFEYKFLLMFAEKVISSTTFDEYINVETNISGEEFKKIVSTLSNIQEVCLPYGTLESHGVFVGYWGRSMETIEDSQRVYKEILKLPKRIYEKVI